MERYAERPRLPLIIAPTYFQEMVRAGVTNKTWLYYDTAENMAYDTLEPITDIVLDGEHMLLLPDEVAKRGVPVWSPEPPPRPSEQDETGQEGGRSLSEVDTPGRGLSAPVAELKGEGVNGIGPQTVTQRVVTLAGRRASQHLPMTLDLLNRAGADVGRVDDRQGGRMRLSEERGARLALTLASVAPVQKPSRAALIRAGVSEMCDEEVYYWYAKMSGAFEPSGANNALRALRVLLAGE